MSLFVSVDELTYQMAVNKLSCSITINVWLVLISLVTFSIVFVYSINMHVFLRSHLCSVYFVYIFQSMELHSRYHRSYMYYAEPIVHYDYDYYYQYAYSLYSQYFHIEYRYLSLIKFE